MECLKGESLLSASNSCRARANRALKTGTLYLSRKIVSNLAMRLTDALWATEGLGMPRFASDQQLAEPA